MKLLSPSVYHALRQNVRKFLTFYLPKLLILSPIFLCALTLAIWEKCSELRDPTWIHFVDGNYSGFKTFFYLSVAMYMIYLLFLMFTAYSDLASMQYFDMRLKFLSLLMIFVMTVTISTTLSRFGGIGIVEDNFVGQLATNYKSSAHFMCFYGMINFYVITIAYVYSPVNTINGEISVFFPFCILSTLNFYRTRSKRQSKLLHDQRQRRRRHLRFRRRLAATIKLREQNKRLR